jgi:hypothetical protein
MAMRRAKQFLLVSVIALGLLSALDAFNIANYVACRRIAMQQNAAIAPTRRAALAEMDEAERMMWGWFAVTVVSFLATAGSAGAVMNPTRRRATDSTRGFDVIQ